MEKYFVVFLIICTILFFTIIQLLRKNHLREKYAILWIFIVVVMPIVFFSEPLVEKISLFVGIQYPPTLVFIGAIIGLLLLTLMLSVIDSHQTDRIIALAQKIAEIEEKINGKKTSG